MSHFLVLVLIRPGTNPNSEVERLLAPFHEFECTGQDDEFVKNIDDTDNQIKYYMESKTRRIRTPNGKLLESNDEQFYRDPTEEELKKIGRIAGSGFGNGLSWSSRDWNDGKGYRCKVFSLPEGYEEIQMLYRDVMGFKEWLIRDNGNPESYFISSGESPDLKDKHKYGYAILDEDGNVAKVIRRTNPNKKWDSYSIGGRWDGVLVSECRRDCNNPYEGEPDNGGNVIPVMELGDNPRAFAIVTPEGEWIEQGTMGWWGSVSNSVSDEDWMSQKKIILAKYQDCLAVAVDCHI